MSARKIVIAGLFLWRVVRTERSARETKAIMWSKREMEKTERKHSQKERRLCRKDKQMSDILL